MKLGLIIILALYGIASAAYGTLLLHDEFNNSDLPTATQINGGYYVVGEGNGEVVESGTVAQISNSSNKNYFYGMLSSNSVTASAITASTNVETTWVISNSSLQSKSSSLIFTWQTSDIFTLSPEFGVIVDLQAQELSMFANSTNNILDTVQLDPAFGDDDTSFSLTATFSDSQYSISGTDSLLSRTGSATLLSESWDSFTPTSTDDWKAGVFVNANGVNGIIADVDSITIESVPEPAVIGLISLCGLGALVFRRIFHIGA